MVIRFPYTVDTTRGPVTFRTIGEPIAEMRPEGTRVRCMPGGFTGTFLGYTRQGDAIVWMDTHFGVPVTDFPAMSVVNV